MAAGKHINLDSRSLGKHFALVCASVGFLLLGFSRVFAAELPQYDQQTHMGVATCANSSCHASKVPADDSNVLQSEYLTWLFHDQHAKAFNTLRNAESKQIAAKLGIGDPATASICLDCHADNVPLELRGAEFHISDGVGCEACHGGAENWLAQHTVMPYDLSRNLADGMYPTAELGSRTRLCVSCHVGTEKKFATHQIMGAGHPRLGFELDTFTQRQPPHHDVDEDYLARKITDTAARRMMVGTAISAQALADNLSGGLLNHPQGYPELGLFDCHACHHSLNDLRWRPRPSTAELEPGSVRVNDGVFLVLAALVGAVDRAQERSLRQAVASLHMASKSSLQEVRVAGARLKQEAVQIQLLAESQDFQQTDLLNMANQLIELGASGELQDYVAAEHALMCLDSLQRQLDDQPKLASLVDYAFQLLSDEDRYSERQLRKAMRDYRQRN
ncbi:multiheme c-type cytochrome [Arenicella xantha]|uniref:Cytochrome c554/c'-like protein n=1 Tax=Arenicella xantha TaxID=644221 RepID=A0A395JHY5_9GAMM|nr:multiheme c-type cytochrome [Arenicella xantha]RBP47131.1 cytochrome c554/c'-like protein [Arenicella xantha]